MKRTLLLALVLAAFAPLSARAEGELPVVATFSILGDMVSTIGGDDVAVTTLVGPDADAHSFEPAPADAKALAGAKLVVANGLGFEGWMDRLVKSSGFAGKTVIASQGITPRVMDEDGTTVTDPHAWQNVANARLYSKNIADALVEAIPAQADAIRARAKAYDAQLATLDTQIRSEMAAIPADSRKVITSHDAFGYFADAYGLKMLAPEGVSTEAEPTAATVASLIDQIKAEHVTTLFVENMTSPRLITRIAQETGAKLGAPLYADALSAKDGPAPTYLEMMRQNVKLMTDAMQPR